MELMDSYNPTVQTLQRGNEQLRAKNASLKAEPQSMTPMPEGYETARLRFFRDLLEGERLHILVELDALPENFDEGMSQGLERRLLDMLIRNGKLGAVEKMIDRLISERKPGATKQ